MGPTCGPTMGPVGLDNVGPTSGPHYGPTSRSRHMWGPRNQLYVGLLNSNKINPHSTYVAPHKILWDLVKSICTPRTTNLQKTPQDFCKTNPLNVYWWRVKSLYTFTHCIYHNIDTYDDCHIQAFSLRTHRQSGDVNLVKTPWTFGEINPQSMDGNFTKKALGLCECLQKTTWNSTKSTRTLLVATLWEKKPWSLAKPICTRRTSNSQKTSLMCIRDGFNRLAHLHTTYTTALTPIMTVTYKLSRYERMDDP